MSPFPPSPSERSRTDEIHPIAALGAPAGRAHSRLWLPAFMGVVLLVAAYFVHHPEYNWDMVPYTAAVLSMDSDDPVSIHRETYRLLRAEVPPSRMPDMLANEYTRTIAGSPRALMQQLPFYRIKPAYVRVLRVLFLLGVSPARATVLVSAAAYVCICLMAWAWLATVGSPGRRFVMASLVALSQPLLHLAGLTNPDALSTATVVLAFYLFLVRGRPGWAMLVLFVSVLVRSDNSFLCALFGVYLVWRWRRMAPARALVGAAGALAALTWVVVWHRVVGDYSWRLMMYHSFIQPVILPADGMPPMSTTQLAKLWVGGLASLRYSPVTLVLLLLAGGYAHRRTDPARRHEREAAQVLLVSIAVHFLVFPNLEERFFVAHMVVFSLIGAAWLLAPAASAVDGRGDVGRGRGLGRALHAPAQLEIQAIVPHRHQHDGDRIGDIAVHQQPAHLHIQQEHARDQADTADGVELGEALEPLADSHGRQVAKRPHLVPDEVVGDGDLGGDELAARQPPSEPAGIAEQVE